jgi:hypothetical protein
VGGRADRGPVHAINPLQASQYRKQHGVSGAKSRKNYAGTSPITRRSGKKKTVLARHIHNDRLIEALTQQAFTALTTSPGARAYYDQLRARGLSHYTALRQLANRLSASCTDASRPAPATTRPPPGPAHGEDRKIALDIQAHGMSFEPHRGEAQQAGTSI